MLKSILLFIKAHAVATAITTTAVVTTAVATPIVVENYKLDKEVESKLDLLVSSNFKAENNNDIVTENQNIENQNTENNQNINASQEIISKDKPLIFRIERVEKKGKDWESVEYKIVPSYDKDISKWTKEEKKAYLNMEEEANRLILEEHNKIVANEEKNMQDALAEIPKIEAAYSKTYSFTCLQDDGSASNELWNYNFYQKTYSGAIDKYEGKVSIVEGGGRITIENFRNIVYPLIIKKVKAYTKKEIERMKNNPNFQLDDETIEKQERQIEKQQLDDLEELYHLSD